MSEKKQSLYQIETTHLELMNEIENLEGEITPEMEKALAINEKDRDIKSIAYLEVMKQREAFNLIAKDEITRLQGLIKRNTTLMDRLKSNLLGAVNLFGEFSVGTVTFGARKSTRLIVDDEDKISKEWMTRKVTTSVNKKDLKSWLALDENNTSKGAHLETNYNLSIK